MSDLENRIEKLEKQTGANKAEPVTLVVVYDDTGKPSEAELEKAKAKYRKEHPDWQEQDFDVIWVVSEDCKRALDEFILQGEGTE